MTADDGLGYVEPSLFVITLPAILKHRSMPVQRDGRAPVLAGRAVPVASLARLRHDSDGSPEPREWIRALLSGGHHA